MTTRTFFACALLWSCGEDSAASPSEIELVLGTGEQRFETLLSGAHLELHAGTQGGHHVWLSMRAKGLEPAGIRMVLDVIPTAPAPAAHTDVVVDFGRVLDDTVLSPDAGPAQEWAELVGWPARVLAPECAAGKSVQLKLSLEDVRGRTAHAGIDVVSDPPMAGFQVPCDP